MFTKLTTFFSEDGKGFIGTLLTYTMGKAAPIINPNWADFIIFILQCLAYGGTITIAIFTVVGYLQKWGIINIKWMNKQ